MNQQSSTSSDWRIKWAGNQGATLDPVIGQLIDLDLRIASLPAGEAKNNLMQWLDRIGSRQVATVSLVGLLTENNQSNSITILQDHVTEVEFYYRNFRTALSLAWLLGIAAWITFGFFLYLSARVFIRPLVIPTDDVGDKVWQLWFLIFLAGIGGSAIAGLWRIYTQEFDYGRAISSVRHPENAPLVSGWRSKLAQLMRLRFFRELLIPELPRAFVRPPPGRLFAWGIPSYCCPV